MLALSMTHSVELSAEHQPLFPDRCLVCGREQPGDSASFTAVLNAYKPLDEEMFKSHQAALPVCTGCKPKLRRSRWIGKLVIGVGTVVASVLILILSQLELAWFTGWKSYAVIGVLLLGPLLVASMIYTAHFDFSPFERRVHYDFRDRGYAEAFAELNGSKVR